MNRPEYNQKMKRVNRDIKRLKSEIDTLSEKLRAARVKKFALQMKGWDE
jgi:outer membrane murein-binding lipoprotein Lpp